MLNDNIELSENYLVYRVMDIESIDLENIYETFKSIDLKVEIIISDIKQLEYFNLYKLNSIKDVHLTIVCNKQLFVMINFDNILKNTLIKSIDIKDYLYTINCYTCVETNEVILKNNLNILSHAKYNKDDVQVNSKIFEILDETEKLLNTYNYKNDRINDLKINMDKLNKFTQEL